MQITVPGRCIGERAHKRSKYRIPVTTPPVTFHLSLICFILAVLSYLGDNLAHVLGYRRHYALYILIGVASHNKLAIYVMYLA
jgi:hypothetical protein